MKRFVIFLILAGAAALFTQYASASYAVNTDWPDAPCFDVLPVNRGEYKQAWAPYYDYKGSEWMDAKKAEMLDAKNAGNLADWMDNGSENHNVFSYFQSRGEISFPPEYDRPFFEDDFGYYLQFSQMWMILGVVAIVSGSAAVFVFLVRRK